MLTTVGKWEQGDYRIHDALCADVNKDAKRGYESLTPSYKVGNIYELLEHTFDGILEEHIESCGDTQAGYDACLGEATVCACAENLVLSQMREGHEKYL